MTLSENFSENDAFLQRAIEHWLDTANELTYQPLFCELLLSRAYTVKYTIKNTHFEQGKDIVAVSPDGRPCGFQLKGGSINLKRWREEVKVEIDSLVECAIQHPDIDKSVPHISYLVTNGEIEDNVRSEIISLNEGRWKDTPLKYWSRGDLLSGFQSIAYGIMPKDIKSYKQLLDLLFSNGTGFPNLAEVSDFLIEIIHLKDSGIAKEQRRRDIAAGMLYVSMILSPYRKAENHSSTARILIVFLSLILHLADKFSLDETYWMGTYKIVWEDILKTLKDLESEVISGGFSTLDSDPMAKELHLYRKHSATSLIYALKLSQLIDANSDWENILEPEFLRKYHGSLVVWGEASFVPNVMLALVFKNLVNTKTSAIKILEGTVLRLIQENGRNSKSERGLASPYINIDQSVKELYGLSDNVSEGSYRRSSYYLKLLIEMLVQLDAKDFLVTHWCDLSFFELDEFIPKDPNDFYLLHAEEGENRTIFLKKEQKWSELLSETSKSIGNNLPTLLKRFPSFIPLLVSIYPHRLISDVVGYLYLKTAEAGKKYGNSAI